MNTRMLRFSLAAVALLVAWNLDLDSSHEVQAANRASGNDLFYNYYVPPGGYGGVGAQMYACPRPTPPWVGHTYVTYPPLMPHQFLHKHFQVYRRNHSASGRTRTIAIWY